LRRQKPMLFVLTVIVAGSLATPLLGCGGSGNPTIEKANAKAHGEYEVCMEQAEEIANQQGADAGSEHMDQCVNNLSHETYVEE